MFCNKYIILFIFVILCNTVVSGGPGQGCVPPNKTHASISVCIVETCEDYKRDSTILEKAKNDSVLVIEFE